MLDGHLDAPPRSQCDQRPWFDRMSGHTPEAITACQRAEHQLSLDHRELIADALARSRTERQVHKLRAGSASGGREPLWRELLRLVPVRWQAVHHERNDEDQPAAGKVVAANLVRSYCLPRETPRRRVQPQRLLD